MLTRSLIPLVLGSLLTGCASDDVEDTDVADTDVEDTDTDMEMDEAQLRVAHFSPDAPAVDIFVNEGDTLAFTGASFTSASEYAVLPVDSYDVQISAAGTTAADAVFSVEGIAVEADKAYTAIAHGYLAPGEGENGFAVTILVDDWMDIPDGSFRVQVVHAAAAGAFGTVDVWNVSDKTAPSPLVPGFNYGDAVTTDLPAGAYDVCLDVDADAVCDATFSLPELTAGFINLVATNDVDGTPSLVAILEDGTSVSIAAN
jgi:hypothetical protein